jgi:hypothetical protein
MSDHCNERYSMALYRCVDALRRADEDYAKAHGQHQTTDLEWDTAIELGEDMLDELSTDGEQADLFQSGNGSEKRYKKWKGDNMMKDAGGKR